MTKQLVWRSLLRSQDEEGLGGPRPRQAERTEVTR
jgi:hypothetical protein